MKVFMRISLALVMAAVPAICLAQGIGSTERGILSGLLSGNTGLAIGLVAGLTGLYVWLVKQQTWGLMMILLGAAFTAFPGMFTGMYNAVNPIVTSISGNARSAITTP